MLPVFFVPFAYTILMDFQWILLIVSSLVVVSGLLVIKIERLYLTEPLLAMLVGIAVSSLGFKTISTSEGETQVRFLEIASQLTISLSLMAAAYKIPRNYPSSFGKSQAVILLLVMPLMFLASGLIAYCVFSFPLAVAFLVGAVITPTDPVVSSTIVSGKFAEKLLPASLRHTLSFESAANDGLAYPLVLLVLFVLGHGEATTGGRLVAARGRVGNAGCHWPRGGHGLRARDGGCTPLISGGG